jgi:hypothetical protein
MALAVVLAKEKPIKVAVAPDATVGVTVVGLPDVPTFEVAFDLNAMMFPYQPSAIAMAIA